MKTVKLGYVFFLAIVAALGGLLFGYDTAVISGTIYDVVAQFHLDVMQQGWYVGCALIGSICGVAIAGIMSDRLGRTQEPYHSMADGHKTAPRHWMITKEWLCPIDISQSATGNIET